MSWNDEEFAASLWSRVRDLLPDEVASFQPGKVRLHGLPVQSVWNACGLSDHVQVFKYGESGIHPPTHTHTPFLLLLPHLHTQLPTDLPPPPPLPRHTTPTIPEVGDCYKPHTDVGVTVGHDQRSFCSLVVCLNPPHLYKGGHIKFLPRHDNNHGPTTTTDLRPGAGCALIYDHELLVEEEPVVEGTRYVLKADVVYLKVCRSAWCGVTERFLFTFPFRLRNNESQIHFDSPSWELQDQVPTRTHAASPHSRTNVGTPAHCARPGDKTNTNTCTCTQGADVASAATGANGGEDEASVSLSTNVGSMAMGKAEYYVSNAQQ